MFLLQPWKKYPDVFSLVRFRLASSWSVMSAEVVSTVKTSWWDGSRVFCHFSRSFICTSDLVLIIAYLFKLPVRSHEFSWLCDHQICQHNRASSSGRNLVMTLEHSLTRTWLLPLFSGLLMLLKASASTFMHAIMAAQKEWQKDQFMNLYILKEQKVFVFN